MRKVLGLSQDLYRYFEIFMVMTSCYVYILSSIRGECIIWLDWKNCIIIANTQNGDLFAGRSILRPDKMCLLGMHDCCPANRVGALRNASSPWLGPCHNKQRARSRNPGALESRKAHVRPRLCEELVWGRQAPNTTDRPAGSRGGDAACRRHRCSSVVLLRKTTRISA